MTSIDLLPEKRIQSVEKLVAGNKDDAESHLAIAGVALDAGQVSKAREHALAALDIIESPRACLLMAQIEEADQHAEKAAKWHARAAKAFTDPAWTCESCKVTAPQWTLHCKECDAFDGIHWRINRHPYVADAQAKLGGKSGN